MPPLYIDFLQRSTSSTHTPQLHTRSNLHRRWSSCSYYDTSCSTHRTILLSIIIAVIILKILIITLLCVRHHRRKALRQRTANQAQQASTLRQMDQNYDAGYGAYGIVDGKPAAGDSGNSRADDGFREWVLEAPPPAYSRASPEVRHVR